MLGVDGALEVRNKKMVPHHIEVGSGSVEVVSMGFLSGEDDAIMWRGLMLNRAVQHFLEDVDWGDLDYLIVDMPPGTGDVQMGLARMVPRCELLIVTTPALGAQKVAGRAADMARRGHLRVAGVIENMARSVFSSSARFRSTLASRPAAMLGYRSPSTPRVRSHRCSQPLHVVFVRRSPRSLRWKAARRE